ncbi:cytochrome P450 [Rostrohypoxylon terebratum]|nr:cytochrome P450 [Rostrohypoxylon terebratum]
MINNYTDLALWALLKVETTEGYAILATAGIVCHRAYFIHGEHHLKAPFYLKLWTFISLFLLFVITKADSISDHKNFSNFLNPIVKIAILNFSFLGPLFLSIATYRIFEHPLREFDGPRLARLTKLWHFKHMFNTSNHLFLDKLYRQYGEFVRTGPQELTIVHPDVWQAIGSPGTSCIKSAWYDMIFPYVAMNSIRTKDGYAPRRKRWDEAFGMDKISSPNKQLRITHFSKLLLKQLRMHSNQPINATLWFHNFFFGVMGDLAFGDDFSHLDQLNEQHYTSTLLTQGMSMLRFFTPAPWIGQLCLSVAPYLPLVSKKWNRMLAWAVEICNEKLKSPAEHDDEKRSHTDSFTRFVISARRDNDKSSLDNLALYGDALLMMVAGSHTTAATLTMLLYELARHQDIQDALRDEITNSGISNKKQGDDQTYENLNETTLGKLPFLNACINESLRLYPPVPTGGIRQTVEKGIVVNGRWIPPHTIIVAPRWSIGRSESAFDRATDFIPERWTTRPSMIKDARAPNSFGTGRHTCPGKHFGLMELRTVIAMILLEFSFDIPHPDTNHDVIDGMQDGFTMSLGGLELVFTPIM